MTTTAAQFLPIDRDEVPFGSRRQAAEDIARDLRTEGRYAVAIFRPELGGWGVQVRAWA